ncbi:MAG: c-type cytochrome, partial [Blastocatellia bacterium]
MRNKKRTVALFIALAGLLMLARGVGSTSAHDGHKHSNAPASAKKLKNPVKVSDENIAAGRTIFNQRCASCHGEDGKAKTDMADSMKKKPTDLTAKEMRGITDGEIYWVITNGIKKGGMPAFKAKANDRERWQMTLYVKHLMGDQHVGQSDPHAGHAAVNQRGDKVMGFSYEKTAHHFLLKPDGGLIEVEVKDKADAASRDQIQSHLKHIAQKFADGDFTAPMLIHDKVPPGVPTMKDKKSAIKYQFEQTELGGRIRITTSDATAIAAIHEFLRFQ